MAVLLRHLDRDFEEVVGRSFLTRDYGAERSRRVRRADARDITFPDLVHAVCGIGKRRRLVISSMRSEQCPIINVKICVCNGGCVVRRLGEERHIWTPKTLRTKPTYKLPFKILV